MSRHVLIAGTGRAGTSFLVRYLTRMGLDTHLSRTGSDPGANIQWDTAAQAGLETLPHPGAQDLPYVIKSPWTYQVIHQILAAGTLEFDAVIIPMRELIEAASSRSIIETQALHRIAPWMADLDQTWEHHGHTPGGIVYSLNPIDQARLLAVGFHQLLDQIVRADIPVVLLSFPRLVQDADYLFHKLAGVLPPTSDLTQAREAHAELADPAKVRVGHELRDDGPVGDQGFRLDGPAQARLDQAALTRLLRETRHELDRARGQLAECRSAAAANQLGWQQDVAALCAAEAGLAETAAQRDTLAGQIAALHTEIATLRQSGLAASSQAHGLAEEVAELQDQLSIIKASPAWQDAQMFNRAPRLAAVIRWLMLRAGPVRRPRWAAHVR